jgi:hypothetical protein
MNPVIVGIDLVRDIDLTYYNRDCLKDETWGFNFKRFFYYMLGTSKERKRLWDLPLI